MTITTLTQLIQIVDIKCHKYYGTTFVPSFDSKSTQLELNGQVLESTLLPFTIL